MFFLFHSFIVKYFIYFIIFSKLFQLQLKNRKERKKNAKSEKEFKKNELLSSYLNDPWEELQYPSLKVPLRQTIQSIQ